MLYFGNMLQPIVLINQEIEFFIMWQIMRLPWHHLLAPDSKGFALIECKRVPLKENNNTTNSSIAHIQFSTFNLLMWTFIPPHQVHCVESCNTLPLFHLQQLNQICFRKKSGPIIDELLISRYWLLYFSNQPNSLIQCVSLSSTSRLHPNCSLMWHKDVCTNWL